MSTVKYSDVNLALVKTNSFAQEPVYSDDGIDYLYHKYTIDVTCVFNASVMAGGVSPTEIMNAVRSQLLRPRSGLIFKVGTETLLEIFSPDAKGGPFPRSCNIKQIHGTTSFMVDWVCEAHQVTCTDESFPVLSNRWTMEQNFDENLFCTRTTAGRLVTRPNDNLTPINLDQFRSLCMPALPKGYKRDRINFGYSSDGLSLTYQIIDREVDKTAPSEGSVHSTTATGRYTQSVEQHGGRAFAEISIELSGLKGTSRLDLIAMAAQIILSRITANDIIESASVSEELFDNHISMTVRALKNLANMRGIQPGMLMQKSEFGKYIPYTITGQPDLDDRTGLLTYAIASFGTQCTSPLAGIGPIGPLNEDSTPTGTTEGEEPEIDISLGDLFQDYDAKWTPDHKNNLYHDYYYDVSYESMYTRAQMPSADPTQATSFVVSLAAPTQVMVVKYRGERYDAWPKGVSDGVSSSLGLVPNYIVLSSVQTAESPQLAADGTTVVYAIKGEVRFAVKNYVSENAGRIAGSNPYIVGVDSTVPAGTWVTSILFG